MDPIVEVQDLVKVYNGSVRAVDGVSFRVERGEIFGFLGPNGAGKSTTIKVFTTLLQKTAGKVRIDGIDLDEDPGAIREIIGYASQEVSVDDDLTARENLRLQFMFHHFHKSEAEPRIGKLLEAVDLVEAADRRAGTFSGGMRKRLDLASALVGKPKLLFLDEPTTGLDPQSRQAMWSYMRDLNANGTTIFLTTQYMEEADRLADRLCIIDHGRIVAEGTPSSLKAEIGADVIELALPEDGAPTARSEAHRVLQAIPGVRQVQDVDGGCMVYVENGPSLVPQIVRSLDDSQIRVRELTVSAPSLDDVFVKHTGRKMRVEEARPVRRTMYAPRRRR